MSFPRYERYKDSGVEWLGTIPAHWTATQLKRVATIRYGIGEPPKYHDDGTPLIRATNVHAGRLFAEGMHGRGSSNCLQQSESIVTTLCLMLRIVEQGETLRHAGSILGIAILLILIPAMLVNHLGGHLHVAMDRSRDHCDRHLALSAT